MKAKFKVPLYFVDVVVFVKEELEHDYAAYVEIDKDTVNLYIRPDADESIVAHEAVHITNEVFKRSNIRPCLYNDEPYAYLLGFIVKNIHMILKK